MLKFNFDKIVTSRELKNNLNDEIVNNLKLISNVSSQKENNLKKNGYEYIYTINIQSTSRNIPRIKYPDLSFCEKEILSCLIMFNNENFIRTLVDLNISFEKLANICSNLSAYKKLSFDENYELYQDKNFLKTQACILKICKIIQERYYCGDFYLIINNLNYIVTFEKDLYNEIQKKYIYKSNKTH